MLLYALLSAAFAGTLPGIPATLTETDGGWTISDSSGVLTEYDGWKMTLVDGEAVTDMAELGAKVFDLDEVTMTVVQVRAPDAGGVETPDDPEDPEDPEDPDATDEPGDDTRARERELVVPINIAGIRLEETLPWPEGAASEVTWATTRFQQPLLTGDGSIWSVNPTHGEVVAAREGTTPVAYRFPENFFMLEADWYIDGVAYSDSTIAEKFEGAYILGRWKKANQDVLLVPTKKGLEVHFVDLARHHGRFPTCDASVPETCLTYGLEILANMSEVEGAAAAANAQFVLGCQAGIGRACLEIVAHDDNEEIADIAEGCIDGDEFDCADVGSRLLERGGDATGGYVALNILQHSCDLGLAAACRVAADHVLEKDEAIDHAIALLDSGCIHGDRAQCDDATTLRHKAFATQVAAKCTAEPADADSCYELGKLLELEEVEHIELHPFDAFQVSCTEGNEDACKRMGYYVDRWGLGDDRVVRATTDLLAACHTAGKSHACVGAAHLLVRLKPSSKEYAQSRELYIEACEAGEISGCIGGASHLWIKKAKRVKGPDNIELATMGCDKDSPEACNLLGKLHNQKRSGLNDAIVAWDKGCELGSMNACTQVGILLVERRHPKHKELKPADEFRRACEQGDPEGCYRLGLVLSPGVKIPSDAEAFDLFVKACDEGYSEACERLGMIHLTRKTFYEAEIAARYLTTGCNDRLLESCAELSKMYKHGNGVQKDRGEARSLALQAGTIEPRKNLRIGGKLGFLNLLGLEAEVMVPTPFFGLSIGTDFSYLPGGSIGSIMYLGPTVRMYPSSKGRGVFMTVGYHRFTVNALETSVTNDGFNVKFGVRSQQGVGWVSSEFGLGSMSVPVISEIIAPIPVLVPMFAMSGGFAAL